ncbi:hypothetical protein F4779DRAFT_571240 [Xylariaceae sp. FL0662B]|nr:hypothetical protein F4779DRAFT_571240 [Xylariaceae sp. FL0662B]
MTLCCASIRRLYKSQWLGYSCLRAATPAWRCSYSSNVLGRIKSEMMAREPQISRDVMSPTNSNLLDIALADFIPENCQSPAYRAGGLLESSLSKSADMVGANAKLPHGHHLVYFPLQKPASKLQSDGTDPYHSPGDPYIRRMWAGGFIKFHNDFLLDSQPVVCVESIDNVLAKGPEGQEKIFVSVLREYMGKSEFENPSRSASVSFKGITERRTLVFMRGMDQDQSQANLAKASKGRGRIVKAPHPPDFLITLTPTPTLLFHYSALTFNAHLIHLDAEYCRKLEGHRDLLVHGPLTVTLMLSVLRSQLDPHEKVHSIDYRNLAPLYANEPMNVCVRHVDNHDRPPGDKSRKWEVWVEDRDGGLSVKGTAESIQEQV